MLVYSESKVLVQKQQQKHDGIATYAEQLQNMLCLKMRSKIYSHYLNLEVKIWNFLICAIVHSFQCFSSGPHLW